MSTPPRDPGKPDGGMRLRSWLTSEWRPLFGIVLGSVAFVAILMVASGSHAHPDANEFCRGHGGVRNLDAGGFYAPPTATCMDGTAGRVWL